MPSNGNHWSQRYLKGGIASVTAEAFTFPLDLAKTRLQIQGQIIDAQFTKLQYRGPIHAVRKIAFHEGFLALYSGMAPALLRQFLYGGFKRGMYETMQGTFGSPPGFSLNFIMAFTSGATSAVLCNPVDILKVRMQTKRIPLRESFIQLYRRDGVRFWFRGVWPNFWRTGVLVGTTFSIYDETKYIVANKYGLPDGIVSYTLSSSCASFIGTLVANPFDVIKSRMMNQCRNTVRYNSTYHCALQTWKSEGVLAFYKGCLSLLCRTMPWHFVFFLMCEHL